MIAYIHVGLPKTGTTTIQKFLSDNFLNPNQCFVSPKQLTITSHNRHRKIVRIIQKKSVSYNEVLDFKKYLQQNQNSKFIFSAEDFVWDFIECKNFFHKVKEIKIFFNNNGFNKIFIIIYLRDYFDFVVSLIAQMIKNNQVENTSLYIKFLLNYKYICQVYTEVFGKENLIVRLFDNNEFHQGDLLKDFIYSIGLEWDDEFIIPPKQNESLDLLGIELLRRLNSLNLGGWNKTSLVNFVLKHFTSKDPHLKFQPPKEIMQSYINYFEESNEWVRKEFFPHKERLFPKKDLSSYKENYELKEMKPEYWDKIAEFIADIVKTKNQILNKTIKEKDNIINSNINHINQLQSNIQENLTQLNQAQSKLSFQTKYGTAKTRIQNQLSYKLGQAMIVNSKYFLGYLIMPIALLSIMISHKQEQKNYQEKIKKDPSLKLPPLESYPDYKEALKLKNHLSYKLGEALIQANKTWYGGGVYQTAI